MAVVVDLHKLSIPVEGDGLDEVEVAVGVPEPLRDGARELDSVGGGAPPLFPGRHAHIAGVVPFLYHVEVQGDVTRHVSQTLQVQHHTHRHRLPVHVPRLRLDSPPSQHLVVFRAQTRLERVVNRGFRRFSVYVPNR